MAEKMKTKYMKYSRDPDILNILLLIVVVIDPRYKLFFQIGRFLKFLILIWQLCYKINYSLVWNLCLSSGGMEGIQSESQETHSSDHYGYCQFLQSTESSGCITDRYGYNQFLQSSGPMKSELDKILGGILRDRGFGYSTLVDFKFWMIFGSCKYCKRCVGYTCHHCGFWVNI